MSNLTRWLDGEFTLNGETFFMSASCVFDEDEAGDFPQDVEVVDIVDECGQRVGPDSQPMVVKELCRLIAEDYFYNGKTDFLEEIL